MPKPNALAMLNQFETRDGPLTEDELILVKYGSFYNFERSRARAQVRHFAGYARRAMRGLRIRRELRRKGSYDNVSPADFTRLIDSDKADIRFYLRERRKWLSHQLKLERERLAQAHDVAAE